MTELLDLASSIAAEAASLAKRRRAEGVRVEQQKSSIVDIVTAADREVELLVVERILAARPNDGVLGEEGTQIAGTSGTTWVIDPIDGTVNYLYDIPTYAVSIAAVDGDPDPATWTALAGCVVNAATGETFAAAAGRGATLDGSPIRVAAPVPLEIALIGTGFGYLPERRVRQAAVLQGLLGTVRDVRRIGSAALDLCSVACGRFDAYYERGLKPWDMAAGALIAAEAGADVRGWAGAPAGEAFIAAGSAAVLDDLWPHFERLDAPAV